jgi:hypothetical protein
MSNYQVSGFGGRLLRTLPAGAAPADSVTNALANLGLVDCEQLIGAAAVKGIPEKLQKKLGMTRPAFNSLLESARNELPAGRAELLGRPAPRDLGFGLREPSADSRAAARLMPRAQAVSAAEVGALPEAVDLIPFMPPIRNQGGRPTCAAFALTALNEYVRRQESLEVDLSEQHLYYEAKLIDGDPAGCGTWLAKAVTALRDSGQCRESIWPYDPTLPCADQGTPPATAKLDGLNYRLQTFAVEEQSVPAYQAQLAKAWPVAVAIPTYDSWYESNEVRRSGRITMPIGDEAQAEGHALVVVGYQKSPSSPGGGYFIVRNSWGTAWAYESPYRPGYGTIPYQYITDDAWEAFAITLDLTVPFEEPTETVVRIKVGSNVEITIEDVTPNDAPGRVSRVSRGRPRPLRVSGPGAAPPDNG